MRFNATVNSATFFGGVVSNRTGFAVANRVNTARFYAVLLGQNLLNGASATLGQLLVVSVWTYGVSVTFDSGSSRWVLLHEVSQVLDVAVAVRLDNRLVEVELDVQLNTYDFGNCWAAVGVNGNVGWGVWAFVDVVADAVVVAVGAHFSNWSWSDFSSLRATAEVQADTNAWRPLGVALVDVVLSFNASTSVEHVGDVPLGTSANVGEGGLVTTTTAGLADGLVGETSRHVRTDCVVRVVEVVQSVQGGVRALDVLAIFATSVVDFVVAQTQFNVVGQEVTDRAAEQVAVVLEVTLAVEEFFLVEAFDFYSACALGQSAERSSGNERANGQAQSVFQFHPLNPHRVIDKQSHQKPGDNSTASLAELTGGLETFAGH